MAVVYTGIINQASEEAIADTLIAFELENMQTLESWDGDLSKLATASDHLEKLFADIDKEKN